MYEDGRVLEVEWHNRLVTRAVVIDNKGVSTPVHVQKLLTKEQIARGEARCMHMSSEDLRFFFGDNVPLEKGIVLKAENEIIYAKTLHIKEHTVVVNDSVVDTDSVHVYFPVYSDDPEHVMLANPLGDAWVKEELHKRLSS